MLIIGLHGVARSGKDTLYKLLAEELDIDYHVRRDAFADRLKISAMAALGYDKEQDDLIELANILKEDSISILIVEHTVDKDIEVVADLSGREYLQYYGTEAHRDVFNHDFWLDAVLPKSSARNDCDVLIVTDVRFDNEAQRVRDCGGVVWRIRRDEVEKDDGHASESGISSDLIDYTIDNNGSLEELKQSAMVALAIARGLPVPTKIRFRP